MMGVEQPLPGSGAFQRPFCTSHFVGTSPGSVLPLSCGPRQCGQFSWTSAAATVRALSKPRRVSGVEYFALVQDFTLVIEQKIGANDKRAFLTGPAPVS